MNDLVATLLTGARPQLLSRALASLRASPDLLATKVDVFHNGGDRETTRVLDSFGDVIGKVIVHAGPILPIGEAISRVAAGVDPSSRFWLHLEDDWILDAAGDEWLHVARSILDFHLDVYEVRCREAARPAWRKHFVTGKPIRWKEYEGWRSAEAHLSFAPTLRRTSIIPTIFPVDGEKDAMRKAHATGHVRAGQLVPGVFVHIGDGDSLRKKTGCAA